MTTISATTILRSRNACAPDKILTTLLLRYPRWIHAEVLTHRVFSRNSASSRAIPVKKFIEDVDEHPAYPIFIGKNQPGMQAFEEVPEDVKKECLRIIEQHKNFSVMTANLLSTYGVHKQVVNRYLEPHAHITVVLSGTEWDNFLRLRNHKDAEPHFQMLAKEILKCLEDESNIKELEPGQWHLPFITEGDIKRAMVISLERENEETPLDLLKKLSVARCASTSYKTVDGFDMTFERAEQIYNKLITSEPPHASPAEHVAQADRCYMFPVRENELIPVWENPKEHGNFIGFRQLRHQIDQFVGV